MKAWRGRARFVKEDSDNEQVKLFLLGGETETSMYLKEIDSIQERFAMIMLNFTSRM